MSAIRLLPLVLIVSLLAGCGGSSGGGSSAKTTPASKKNERAAFIAKADAMCRDTQKRQASLAKQAKGRTLIGVVPLLHQQAALAKGLAKRLRTLTPPPGDQLPVKRYFASVSLIGVLSEAAANSITAGHTLPTEHIKTKLLRVRDRELALGQGYGFKVCASGKGY